MKVKVAKVLIGFVVIGGALSYFIFQTMQSSWSYYFSVDDLANHQSEVQNHSLRLAGKVKQGSVNHDLKQMVLKFDLTGTQTAIPVVFQGVVPENFQEDREVVVEGRLDIDGTFQANTLMTKCESKYEGKSDY